MPDRTNHKIEKDRWARLFDKIIDGEDPARRDYLKSIRQKIEDGLQADGARRNNSEATAPSPGAQNSLDRKSFDILSVIESLSEGVALYDPEDRLVFCNARMKEWNPGSAHLMTTGIKFEELVRANINSGEIVDALEDKETFLKLRLAQHRNPMGSIVQRRKDGSWLEISEQRTPDGYTFVINEDITERVLADLALKRSEERFRHFAESSSDWFWETDEHFAFSHISEGFEERIGKASSSFLGKKRWDDTVVDIRAANWERHKADLEAHKKFKDFEYKRLDGRFIRASGVPYFNADGAFQGYRGVASDITDAKLTAAKLNRSQRLDSIGQLTGGVAHDFNNLLAVVLGCLDLLEDHDLPSDAVELLDNARSALLRGADLTKNMLSFARQAELNPKPTEVSQLVGNAIGWIERTLPPALVIETSLATNLNLVNVDQSSLESALLNLIVNARDAMAGSGKITISTFLVKARSVAASPLSEPPREGTYVALSVTDSGEGIAETDMERIFEPFHTTKKLGEGSGLGLSMVMGFMNQSGGSVGVESKVGEGTTFTLYFPISGSSR